MQAVIIINVFQNKTQSWTKDTKPIIKLNDLHKTNLEETINEHECYTALKEMENNKSHGSDGLSVELYKLFWTDIKHYLIISINYAFEQGLLIDSQKQGIITLLPKSGNDLNNIAN